ncbi:unnamed protein product [Knipowitschia caucasica]|uniref:Uncharacterized protein n=1 Tax=Knipowitschia caucasica TaxID=637954 RepID=A0AAV2LGZ0_KNICA
MDGPRNSSYKHLQEDDPEAGTRCEGSAGGRVGALLSRTSLSHFTVRKGWTEVPCTHLDRAATFVSPSLRARSVPIIPSLQANRSEPGQPSLTAMDDSASSVPYKTLGAGSSGHVSSALTAGSAMELRWDLENMDAQTETGVSERQKPSAGLKATGQRGVQDPCQGQTNLESGSANCLLAAAAPRPSAAAAERARPSAS